MGLLSLENVNIKDYYSKEVNDSFINLYSEFKKELNPSATILGSMVYGFAKHLPYSMDIEHEEFVPGDFLNMVPPDADENKFFMRDNNRTIFKRMRDSDGWESAILLQVCYIFQQMLLGKIPPFELSDSDYERMRVSHHFEDYNKKYFEIMKKLPMYYKKIVLSENSETRLTNLEIVYKEINENLRGYIGAFTEKETYGNETIITKQIEATTPHAPYHDVKMVLGVYESYDGLNFPLTKIIKEEELKNYRNPNGKKLR